MTGGGGLVLRLGLTLVALLALAALLAPWIAPAGPNAQDILAAAAWADGGALARHRQFRP